MKCTCNDWSSRQYLKFKQERTQPSMDLAARIDVVNPHKILDVGCGPGNSSQILRKCFPKANILGIDSSPDMIAKAKNAYNDIQFSELSITPDCDEITDTYDVIFSNACIQWIPEHKTLITNLLAKLNPGGALAIQVPMTSEMPMYKILKTLCQKSRWSEEIANIRNFYTLTVQEYYDLLSELDCDFSIWQTEYMHTIDGYSGIIEWYRGSGLRPYLAAIPESEHAAFLAEVEVRLHDYCTIRKNGKILMPFLRLFMVVNKKLSV